MSKRNIYLLLLLFFHYMLSLAISSTDPNANVVDFIKAECQATFYPALCVQCLTTYSSTIKQSPKQLAEAAISVSLSRAQSVSSFVSKLARMRGLKATEFRAVKDCKDNMANAVDQLSRAVKELAGGPQDFSWRVNSVAPWVGAAMTFQNTCLDGFSSPAMDGHVKVAVKKRVLDCAQVTSNALALVHRFAARHKVGTSSKGTSNLP